MLPVALVQEVDRLLHEGELSQRKIESRLGVSRGTVSAIASGRRGLYGRELEEDCSDRIPMSPPIRCRHCGYRVYMPCLVCEARRYKRNRILIELLSVDAVCHCSRLAQGDDYRTGTACLRSPPLLNSEQC